MKRAHLPIAAFFVAVACGHTEPDDKDITDGFDFPVPGDNVAGGGGSGTDGGEAGGGSTGGFDDTPGEGTIDGLFGLFVEDDCSIYWELTGNQVASADLAWDVALINPDSDCGGVDDMAGTLEVEFGSAYFSGNYIGAATHGGGALSWASYGYLIGAVGLGYYYIGTASYD